MPPIKNASKRKEVPEFCSKAHDIQGVSRLEDITAAGDIYYLNEHRDSTVEFFLSSYIKLT